MSDPQNQVSQRNEKRWIKPGVEVFHREYPDRKMIVDDVLKRTEQIIEDQRKVPKTFIIGVECHWFDESGRYDRGRFLTTELYPWGTDLKKPEIDPESFPKDIPTSHPG